MVYNYTILLLSVYNIDVADKFRLVCWPELIIRASWSDALRDFDMVSVDVERLPWFISVFGT